MKKLTFLFVFLSLLISCKKDDVIDETSNDKIVAEDNSIAENASDDASTMADEAYSNNKLVTRDGQGSGGILADTVKITRVDSTVTIDFGTTGITCKDGRVRAGKLIITFANGFRKAGSSVTHSFLNYSVGGHQISNSSTRTVTYKGLDSNSNHHWEISATMTITKPDGKTINWTSTRTRTMIAGSNTPLNWTDDVYSITGTASGTNTKGSYTLTITKALIVKVRCPHIQDGTLSLTRGVRIFSIDYGYGSATPCDGQAEITLPNGTKTIVTL